MRVTSSNLSHLGESAFLRERELLRDYPELENMVDNKIDEWSRVKGKLFCKHVLPTLKRIHKIEDPFARWYWKQALKYMLPKRYVLAVINLDRLNQLKRDDALSKSRPESSNSFEDFSRKKERARHIPISGLYSFQNLKKKGNRLYALCPLHNEKSSSFVIYPDNSFHCFGCHAHGGDAIDFVRLINRCDFKNAVAQLVGSA